MKTRIFILLLTSLVGNVTAQVNITGYVTDHKGQPIVGANVYLKDTYDGTSTDLEGYFSFVTEETGEQVLIATFIGYKTLETPVNLNEKTPVFKISLKENINKLEAVVISAGSFSAGEETKREVLKPIDIVTTAGSTADIAGALNTLPGTQTVGEEGRLFVRGGSGEETKTYIDGMQVLMPYNAAVPNTPSRGRFSPFMFKGTSFSTGGYSAEYGQALSSALILNTKDIPAHSRTDFSIMSVGLDAATTRVWEKSSFSGKIQYTNISPYFSLVKQSIDLEKPPVALDGNFAFRQQLNKNGLLKFYGNFNRSTLTSLEEDIDDPNMKTRYQLDNDYYYFNTSYQDIINDKWSIKSGFSYTSGKDDIKIDEDKVKESENGMHVKTTFGYDHSSKLSVNFGGEVFHRKYNYSLSNPEIGQRDNPAFDEQLFAGFAEADLYTSNKFVARVGTRWEYSTLSEEGHFAPRLSMGYKTGEKGQVSIAYGQFQQTAQNDLVRVADHLQPEKADHYILNYQWLTDKQTFRIETYYKDYYDLVVFDNNRIYDPSAYLNTGEGYAKGIDLFWRDNKTFNNVDYWVSYSYLDTKRKYRDFPAEAVPTFASEHNFSFVYRHFISSIKCQVGWTYSFASGRPYHNPEDPGFNAFKTKSYHDLSMNISYLWKDNIILHAFVTNVLGTDNVFGYEYGNQFNEAGRLNRRAIRPMAPRFIFLGVFITLSKDKTLNSLPNL